MPLKAGWSTNVQQVDPLSEYQIRPTNDVGILHDYFPGAADTWNNPAHGGLFSGHTLFDLAYAATTRYKADKKSVKIIGASSITFQEITTKASDGSTATTNGLTATLDTTSYADRATIKLLNGLGYDAHLRSIKIDGVLIYQYSGENGELLHDGLRKDDDIRKNGERCLEIGNSFIVDATQCANIADYWWKFAGKKKHLYSVAIPGFCPWYEVGDWYTISVGGAGTNEYISCTVECYAVDTERHAGTIGSTILLLRDVEDSWAKTTLYATRLVSGGSPKRRVNRSNIVTVASSTYDGTYDYRCDGTDDDVQIQAAIDYVSQTFGGGAVQLTEGNFSINAAINMKINIVLIGMGKNTIISADGDIGGAFIVIDNTVYGSFIRDLIIDGLAYTGSVVRGGVSINTGADNYVNIIENIEIKRMYSANVVGVSYGINEIGAYGSGYVGKIYIHDIKATAGNGSAKGIEGCKRVDSCIIDDISGYGAGYSYGLRSCNKCQQNKVTNTTTPYSNSYADAGTSNACADTAAGGYNS